MVDVTNLNPKKVYTLVGKFNYSENEFTTIDGQTFWCYAYRNHSRDIKDCDLCVVNIKNINDAWVIFQAVLLDDIQI